MTTSAKLYIYIGVGSRDLFIDEAHMALGIFPVFFPCMLPTLLCGIFDDVISYNESGVNHRTFVVVKAIRGYRSDNTILHFFIHTY